jgi:hypothetical protein
MIGIGINTTLRVMGGGGGVAPFVGLLDSYPGAAAAYSVRLLKSDYTGNAIRVRRSSDNAEQNIGFDGSGNLDTTALTSFCSGTNGFVTTWYDQSGNGVNVTQGTATQQPQIVSGGSVLLVNGKPAIFSNGTNSSRQCLFNTTQPNLNVPVSDFYAYKVNTILSVAYQAYYDGGNAQTSRGFFGYQQINGFDIIYDSNIVNAYPNTLNQTLATLIRNGASSQIYKNNTLTASGNSGVYTPLIGLVFGEDYSLVGAQSNVYHQEFIRYSGVSSNISAINTNINSYYGIY